MRLKLFLLYSVLGVFIGNAQLASLAELSQNGTLQVFAPILEEDNEVYGYFGLYYIDKLDANSEKYEYAILDKNLNKIANGEFIDVAYKKVLSKYFRPQKSGDKILLTKQYINFQATIIFTSSRFLDLKTNVLSEPFYFEDRAFFEGNREVKTLKKVWKKKMRFRVPVALNDGYIVCEFNKPEYQGFISYPNYIVYYNNNNKKIWDAYLSESSAEKFEFEILESNAQRIYILCISGKGDFKAKVLKVLDSKTGTLVYEYKLEDKTSEYSHTYHIEEADGKAVVVGKISPYKVTGYDKNQPKGFYRIEIDSLGKELSKSYKLWSDIEAFVKLNSRGKNEDGYRLRAVNYYVFNSKIVVLTEKVKLGFTGFKLSDFVWFEFDTDFNLIKTHVIEKNVSKSERSDFLYSQFLNNNKDLVFFYKNYIYKEDSLEFEEDKDWLLGIVSFIDGEIYQEQIPLSSDDFFIVPYIAKKGYILLREHNKDKEFDEIRLEKINLD